ncbi:PREDICTED: CD2 antigen cytoplasmic tail-binding protein 2 homolog [Ceratosolen solmsi marchali]|uniref:CD2 antigen cytoplasmic tail-binding protein 2 homolog n=1 Tax=Ceratosolen solmsi marchali TaxID=326594 RepID=A0AAJ6VLM7_9HYME|nr:PREDICTED: CD2 antigen cytoplasmic tail-binding protein 2 homolog [Ceratosolen solmsi marchali]XP_011494649.1 PREDICTED: CD2 antigen cytoplasmic tail-binding protein 2 homolog [Ceratosolen solmsi marchali]
MSKRKLDEFLGILDGRKSTFQNSLDSDEEDDEAKEENYDIMHENDIEGVEEGPSAPETNVGFTAFNMKEELEEGHFDKEGHYHWKKEKEIRDNWLDNIDWLKVRAKPKNKGNNSTQDKESDDDSDDESDFMFDSTPLYKQILEYLKPGETVSKALCRLGKGKKKLTTAERWKRKKDPNAVVEDENSINITKLTELANELLTRTGNMDIYQESYEQIGKKIALSAKHSHPSKIEAELDMFADDFDSKEKDKIIETKTSDESTSEKIEDKADENPINGEVCWELKWSQEEKAEIHGPHSTEQMQKWAKEGYFKNGAWVRKRGQYGEFYNASRIDFELYL